jgi:hypothetical protein
MVRTPDEDEYVELLDEFPDIENDANGDVEANTVAGIRQTAADNAITPFFRIRLIILLVSVLRKLPFYSYHNEFDSSTVPHIKAT